jgi:type II secretory pathway pseudopilin PulG
MKTAPTRGRGATRGAGGFTLLEVLIATGLSFALLLGLWSLFTIYTNLFEAGQTKTERAQLARALVEQIARDLHGAIQDPVIPASPTPPGAAPVRRFGLFGSHDALRFDVLQVTPRQGNPTPVSDSAGLAEESSPPRAPELRTIYYSFHDPRASATEGGSDLPGLIRRDLDFETPEEDLAGAGLDDGSQAAQADREALLEREEAGDAASPQSAADLVDESILWVPEVVSLRFRYFDGNRWTSQWNSLQQKSLPVAVEISLQLGTLDEMDRMAVLEGGEATEQALAPEFPAVPSGQMHRLVVDLPGSPKHEGPRAESPAPAPEVRTVVRRVAPPRPTRIVPSTPPAPPSRPEDEPMRPLR